MFKSEIFRVEDAHHSGARPMDILSKKKLQVLCTNFAELTRAHQMLMSFSNSGSNKRLETIGVHTLICYEPCLSLTMCVIANVNKASVSLFHDVFHFK